MTATTRTTDRVNDGRRGVIFQEEVVTSPIARYLLAALRIVLGWTFLWPFIDKLFGLGYATEAGRGWLDGGSPTTGFLTKNPVVVEGPLGGFFANFAGGFWDWLFMFALAGIGIAFLFGGGLKIAAWGGALLMALMYLAELPIGRPDMGFTNPITDSHWIEGIALLALAYTYSGDTLGLGKWWGKIVGNGILR
ncbi:DoxX family membrane protein [Marihabitans asiaticum]|uniref:Thiosulfate dehydrogenase [quinone] large subunit n=1 Tax=Marihabitans asiaticum TaxID=415218 RepID=A0A560WI06_9MICO|nr:DoxX family protein [Marihabitans asiaticum]TWD17045.1 thiosulfate dehydrogenase [quinone] large subunit [Marihabitans asiaticum]